MSEGIYERIKQRLDAMGMTERQASLQAGGSSQLIRNIRRGKSASPRSSNIVRLARVLQVSEAWLLGVSDEMGEASPESRPFGVPFAGVVEAGAFRPNDLLDQDAPARRIAIPPDARYPAGAQMAYRVEGDSMTEARIFEGMFVLAVDLHAWERLHGEPRDGMLVVVERHEDGTDRVELTVKRLRIFRDRMELRPESANPRHQPLVFPLPLAQDEGPTRAHIKAVCLQAVWILT